MGNNNITSECCSDRNERQQKMVGRFERPEFYNQKPAQSTPNLNETQLANSSLEPLRQTYDKTLLREVENTLLMRKSKGKSLGSHISESVPKNHILTERSGCGSSTFGDIEKIKIMTIETQNTLMKYLKKEVISSTVHFFSLYLNLIGEGNTSSEFRDPESSRSIP